MDELKQSILKHKMRSQIARYTTHTSVESALRADGVTLIKSKNLTADCADNADKDYDSIPNCEISVIRGENVHHQT